MRYTESIAASAQALRAALPLMSRQRAALHPVTYSVWYEHVTAMNGALSRELMSMTQDGATLDELSTVDRAALVSMAVRFGDTRLIDNEILDTDAEPDPGTEVRPQVYGG